MASPSFVYEIKLHCKICGRRCEKTIEIAPFSEFRRKKEIGCLQCKDINPPPETLMMFFYRVINGDDTDESISLNVCVKRIK